MSTEIKLGEQWSIEEEDGTDNFVLKDRVNNKTIATIPPNGAIQLEDYELVDIDATLQMMQRRNF
jgi:hypothetical protein